MSLAERSYICEEDTKIHILSQRTHLTSPSWEGSKCCYLQTLEELPNSRVKDNTSFPEPEKSLIYSS